LRLRLGEIEPVVLDGAQAVVQAHVIHARHVVQDIRASGGTERLLIEREGALVVLAAVSIKREPGQALRLRDIRCGAVR
jgi:hypothetical protein